MQRRKQLLNESVEKRLGVLDEAELQEARARHGARSDRITMALTAPSGQLGWALHAKLGNATIPTEDATAHWIPVAAASGVTPGDRVRCSAERFEADAKKAFGVNWREHHYYGRVRSRAGRSGGGDWDVRFDGEADEPCPCHFRNLERADASSESEIPAVGKAIIRSLDLDGAVARQAGYPGLVVDTVDGVDVTATQVAGAIAVGFREQPSVVVVLRRPVERRPTRSIARSANNENATYDWHPDVEADGAKLTNNPMNAKRDHVVFEALEALYAHRMADGKRMMPPKIKSRTYASASGQSGKKKKERKPRTRRRRLWQQRNAAAVAVMTRVVIPVATKMATATALATMLATAQTTVQP